MRYPSTSPGRTGGGGGGSADTGTDGSGDSDFDGALDDVQRVDDAGGSTGGGGSNTGAPGGAPAPDPVSTGFDPSIDPDFSTDPAPAPGPGRTEINDNAAGDLAGAFTERVADPLADAAAFASPATELDRVLPGNPVENSVSSFTTGATQLVNPGRRIQDAQALGSAAVEDTRNVVEDGPIAGSRENLGDARTATEQALAAFAGSVQADPVGTLSRTAGSAVAGGVAARAGRNLVPDRNAADPVPSGRSDVGTEGADVILDEDTARALQGRDTSVDRSPDRSGGSSTGGGSDGGLPLEDAITDAGGVRRLLDEQRAGVRDFLDEGGTDRGQLQFGGQGRGTGRSPETDTPDRFTDFDGEDRVSDDLVRESIDRRQRAERQSLEGGDFDGAGSPFGPGSRAGDFSEGRFDPVSGGSSTGGSGAGGAGAGLGSLSSANDPTGVADFQTRFGTGGVSPTAGTDDAEGIGSLSGVNDPTGIANTPGVDTGGELDTGTDGGTDTGPGLDTGLDTGGGADVSGGTDTGTGTLTLTETVTATASGSGAAATPAGDTGTAFGDPDLSQFGDPAGATGGAGGAGSGRGNTPPRSDGEAEQDDEEQPTLFSLGVSDDVFGSGIASAEELADAISR